MRMPWLLNILLFGVFSAVAKRYDEYAIYHLTPQSREALEFLRSFTKYEDVEFLTPLTEVGRTAKVLLPPQHQYHFSKERRSLNDHVNVKVLVSDLQADIDNEGVRPEWKAGSFDWEYYYKLEDMQIWLNGLAEEFPDKVKLFNLKTYENRNLSVVKVSFNPEATKAVFIEAGIHARERIVPAVATYILNKIIRSSDADIVELRHKYNWYIAPVTNPDGYVYTFTDRLWRRTRRPVTCQKCNKNKCIEVIGVDPNRNWDFHFGEGQYGCGDQYEGPYAFSENCTRELSQFLLNIPERIQSYIALHSTAELILIPYSISNTLTTNSWNNYEQVYRIAKEAAHVLESVNGKRFRVGTPLEVLDQGPAYGTSMDWVKDKLKVPFVATYELSGNRFFILPKEEIIPSSEETLQSIVYAIKEADNL